MELIKIETNEQGRKVVSARELYLGLGLNKAHWKRWSEQNIIQNGFFKENIDWVGFTMMVNGNETQDFAISLEFAKHIAMMARTEKSHDYRNYFIECEKKAKANEVPQTYAQALLEAGRLALELEQKQKQIEVMEPKAIAYDKFMEADGTYTTTNACKMLGLKRNKVFEVLRDKGLVYKNKTEATQKAIDRGLFKQVLKNGYPTMVITPKGIDYIKDLTI